MDSENAVGELGAFLRKARLRQGLTQEALAAKASLSVQAIGSLERGERRHPHRDTLDRLSDALYLSAAQRATARALAARRGSPVGRTGAVHQLPAEEPTFVGRASSIAAAVAALTAPDRAPVVSVSGMGGVGKTTFAVHVAHRVAANFPDGQLYLHLGGPQPVGPADALRTMLRGLGAQDPLPHALSELAALLRSELADRRLLLVLDDVVTAEQVRPLLPGAPGCAVVMTSRAVLPALARTLHLDLPVFTDTEALDLLALIVGRDRMDADPAAGAELVRSCDRLPLAVRIAAARLSARPSWPVAYLAARVADERSRLDQLEIRGTGVRATFEVSFRQLTDSLDHVDRAAGAAYPLLALLAAPDVDLTTAARLLDLDVHATEQILERLTDLNVLAAGDPGWYRQIDLLRAVGIEQADAIAVRDKAAALCRVLDLYAAVGWRGVALANPESLRLRWAGAPSPVGFADAADAFEWLYARRTHVVTALTAATDHAAIPPGKVLSVVLSLMDFIRSKGLWSTWVQVCQAGLAVADRGADPRQVAVARSDLAVALAEVAQVEPGNAVAPIRSHAAAGVGAAEQGDDEPLTAMLLNNQCYALSLIGDITTAIDAGERSLALSEKCGSPLLQAMTSTTVGTLHGSLGDPAAEERFYRQAIRIADDHGIIHAHAYALHQLGTALRRRDVPDEAASAFERSAKAWQSLGQWPEEERALAALGDLQLAQGQPGIAATTLRAALHLAVKTGLVSEQRRLRQTLDSLRRSRGRGDRTV